MMIRDIFFSTATKHFPFFSIIGIKLFMFILMEKSVSFFCGYFSGVFIVSDGPRGRSLCRFFSICLWNMEQETRNPWRSKFNKHFRSYGRSVASYSQRLILFWIKKFFRSCKGSTFFLQVFLKSLLTIMIMMQRTKRKLFIALAWIHVSWNLHMINNSF